MGIAVREESVVSCQGRQSVVGCESVRPQRGVVSIGVPSVSAARKPTENFLEEMLDKQK